MSAVTSLPPAPSGTPSPAERRATVPGAQGLLCAGLLVICTLAAFPFADVGVDDDWSYIHSARVLADTGHIVYAGWASAMLGWQLGLGALFIKIFGFSFSAPRASILLVAAVTAWLLQRTFVRFGLREGNASIATLTFCLSPLFLPLAFSFMSDVAGIFATMLCLYLCLRAVQAESNRGAFLWLAFASLSNAVSGTARQTGWMGMLVMVPSAYWLLRRRVSLPGFVAVWLASLAILAGSVRWFYLQPYSLREKVIAGYFDREIVFHFAGNVSRATFDVFLFLLPVTLAFVPALRFANKKLTGYAAIALTVLALFGLYLGHTHQFGDWLAPFGLDGNTVSPRGLVDVPEIGHAGVVLQPWVRGIVTLIGLASIFGVLGFALTRPHALAAAESRTSVGRVPTWRETLILLVPFALAYSAPLLHRALFNSVYDRYLLPLLPMVLIVLVRLYQERVAARLPKMSYAVIAMVALFAIAGTHDVFAMRRARLEAANHLIAAGIPRTAFYGGFEYDGWTQIEAMGFINSGYILMPDGFHPEKPVARLMTVKPCDDRFAQNDPAIQPRFGLSFDTVTCDGPSTFAPVAYRAWLPPFTRQIYTRSVTRPAF